MGGKEILNTDYHLKKFVNFAIEYFEVEEHQKEYERWHLENYGCLPDEYEKRTV